MKINDKVTIIDYDECELYYFNEDINRNELKLHCYIDKKKLERVSGNTFFSNIG